MTNSSHIDQTADFFKTLSLFLVVVSTALLTFVGIQLITNNNVAHADAIAHPTELNAEYFANNTTATAAADTGNEMNTSNGLLAQADTPEANSNSNQCDYLTDNLRIDLNNDSQQVYKLQAFLQAYEYDYVDLTGNFDENTLRAVQEFQTAHADDILEPWGYEPDEATGYVYITTRQKINEIYCNQELELSASAKQEIASYRQKLNNWRAQGADFDTPNYLDQYQTQQSSSDQVADNSSDDDNQGEENTPVVVRESDDSEDTATGTDNSEQEVSGTSTTATNTEEADDGPGFFARLLGQDGEDDSDENNQADTATNSEDTPDNGQEEQNATTSNDEEVATGAVATTGVDQAATSVYSGVNSFVGFIFSPTFLLILLGVLILLLIATLLEGDEEGAYADITADDFAKDFDDSDDNLGENSSDDDTDTEIDEGEEQDTKTKSANFDETPAGDTDGNEKGSDDDSDTTR